MKDKEGKEDFTNPKGRGRGGVEEQVDSRGGKGDGAVVLSILITATPSLASLPNGTSKDIKFTPVTSPPHYFNRSELPRFTSPPCRSRRLINANFGTGGV